MIRTFSLAATAAFFAMPALACDGFAVHEPYARSSTMMSQSGAAFMALHNHGSADCRIVGARSDIAQRTELHTHIADSNGVMRMVEVEDGFLIPAGGEVLLQRGGDHVMFMGLSRPMEQGAPIAVTLIFEDGSEFELTVPVDNERQPDQQGAMGDHAGHGQMAGQGEQSHAAMQGHEGHGMQGAMSMPVDQAGMDDDTAIRAVMMAQFDRPEAPLTVAPVVLQGDTAMAGWAQEGRGGRALLRRGETGWYVAMCAGEQLLDEHVLMHNGIHEGAATLIAAMRDAEAGGAGDTALFNSFTDLLVFEQGEGHAHGH